MGTRRILQGGEDVYPADLGATRQNAWAYSSFTSFSVADVSGTGTMINTLWTPPLRSMIVQGAVIKPQTATQSGGTTAPGTYIEFGIGDPLSDGDDGGIIDLPIFHYTIPHTSWTSKGGGGGFNFTPAFATAASVGYNGFAASGYSAGNGGSDGSGTYYENILGPAGFTNGGYYYDPSYNDGYDSDFEMSINVSGGTSGNNLIGGWTFYFTIWGIWV